MRPPPESFVDLRFPAAGIDLLRAFSDQQGQTTPTGVNVRANEPSTLRARGGSRPGIAKYINQQLPLTFVSGSRVIQHLGVVVQVDGTALLNNYPFLPADFIDPSDAGPSALWPPGQNSRNPGWVVPDGGTGIQPNKSSGRHTYISWANPADITVGTALSSVQLNAVAEDATNLSAIPGTYVYSPPAGTFLGVGNHQLLNVTFTPSGSFIGATKTVRINVKKAGILFVQQNSALGSGATTSLAFPGNVGLGNALVLATIQTDYSTTPPVLTMTDSLGNVYTQVGSTVTVPGFKISVTLWVTISVAAGACTVQAAMAPVSGSLLLGILEYTGVNSASQIDATATNTSTSFANPMTVGPIPVNNAGDMILAVFGSNNSDGLPWVWGNSFNSRIQNLLPSGNSIMLLMGDFLNTSSALTGSVSSATDSERYAAIGASFNQSP